VIPVRTCIGCRAKAPQAELVRLVWDGDGVVVSRTGKGRGAWVHPSDECVAKANRRGALARALRRPGVGDVNLPG